MKRKIRTLIRVLTILAFVACINAIVINRINYLVDYQISVENQFPDSPDSIFSINSHLADVDVLADKNSCELFVVEKPVVFIFPVLKSPTSSFPGSVWQPPKKF